MTATAALPPDAFKETEIGPIPLDWEVVLLGNLINKGHIAVQNGFPHGGHNQQGRGIPHLRPFNINNDGQIDLGAIKYIEPNGDLQRYLLRIGDVLFNNTNSEELVGKTTYWDKPGEFVLSNHMTILRVLEPHTVDAYFLARYFYNRWLDGYFQSICRRHVNQASISLARIEQIPIPLPPLHEQRRIAHVLNTIQREIAAQNKLITAAREVKRSLMQRLFTYGPGAEPAPTKETEIGEVPEHWEVVNVGSLFEIQLGKMLSNVARKGISPRPYLRNANVQWGYIDLSDMKEMDFDIREMQKFQLRKGDILICEGGEIGRTAIWEEQMSECYYQKAIHRLRPKEPNILPRYFLYYMMLIFLVRQAPIAEGAKSTIAHLPVEKLRILPLTLPPLEEQCEIVKILSTADRKIAAEEQRKSALQVLFKSMLHQLMTGQIRVRV